MVDLKKFIPSQHQTAVEAFVKTGRGSAVLIAVAGSGKSTTIEYVLPSIPESKYVTILAFNKTIADELKGRLVTLQKQFNRPFRNFRAATFHSLGGSAVAKYLGKPSVRALNLDDRKCARLFEENCKDPEALAYYASFAVKLVNYAKGEGIGCLVPDTEDSWWKLVRHHDIELDHDEADERDGIQWARKLLEWSNGAAKFGAIDFNDMLYLPLLWNIKMFRADWVMVDEAQDTNPVRRAFVKRILREGGRSLWVGDPKQAIYGFTGASNDAIEIIKHEFNATELPLTVSYRCARSVVEQAKTIVPYIEASDAAPEGKVETMTAKDALELLGAHDAILCRNTAPLIKTAYSLIAKGRGCVVLGREIGQGLVNLIKKLRAKSIDELEHKVEAYREREVSKAMGRGEEQKAERVNDHCDCIVAIIDALPEDRRTIAQMIEMINKLFSDTNGVLTLATVHKSKGKEWHRVAILQPELMPSKWARQDWQVEQEQNLKYVAYTRAKEHLIFMAGEVK